MLLRDKVLGGLCVWGGGHDPGWTDDTEAGASVLF